MWAGQPPSAPSEGPPIEGPLVEVLSQGPLHGPPQRLTPPRLPKAEHFRGLLNGLVNLVPIENRGEARGLAKDLSDLFASQKQGHHHSRESLGGLTAAHLQKVVTEAVQAAVGPNRSATQGRSWAAVAAGPGQGLQAQPTKIIPQRADRELLVRGANVSADLAQRSPVEIIQAINQASTKQGAIAARKLPSGDTVVTFNDSNTKSWHSNNTQWINKPSESRLKRLAELTQCW